MLNVSGPRLRLAYRLTGQRCAGSAYRVEGVGLAPLPALNPVRPVDLDDAHPLNREVLRQPRPIRAGALDTYADNVAERPQPTQQLPVAGRCRRERAGLEQTTDPVERGRGGGQDSNGPLRQAPSRSLRRPVGVG